VRENEKNTSEKGINSSDNEIKRDFFEENNNNNI
jgi:hypothetical protein